MKAAVFNTYLQTFGGGEKDTYAIAHVLAGLGFDVDVLTFETDPPGLDAIAAFFGPGHDGFHIRTVEAAPPGASIDETLRAAAREYSVFINHSASSSFANPCPIGFYFVMFPFQAPGPFLDTYQYYVCNSEYTAFYVRALWGEHLRTKVIYPVSDEPAGEHDRPRRPEILSLGRFNVGGHNKNQSFLLEAFDAAIDRLPTGWRLVLVGKLNDSPENAAYLQTLRDRSRRLPVSFEINVSQARKAELLRSASLYWHATGAGLEEPGDASRMEHFGIALVEAMAAGAVPMSYHRGGPREIIRHGVDGFLYRDRDELVAYSAALACSPHLMQAMRRAGSERLANFGREQFTRRLTELMTAVAVE